MHRTVFVDAMKVFDTVVEVGRRFGGGGKSMIPLLLRIFS
jgi:hypothetical protein